MALFQHCWEVLKDEVMRVFAEFYHSGIIHHITNETYICLIPKKTEALRVEEFRPISLISSLYKIIAKVLANRLRAVLGDTIAHAQGAFVKDRQILDAVLIANEVVEEIRTKKKKGYLFKIDFEKAYDHVDWAFLDFVLERKGFGSKWRRWISGCVKSANFSVLINGRPRGKFGASRGIRQGDPLSPFLFTLVADMLGRMMMRARERGAVEGLVVGRDRVMISHLQFADDTVFLLSNKEDNLCNLMRILEAFNRCSGLKINKDKCSIVGINLEEATLERIAIDLGCERGSWPMNYLGLPLGGKPRSPNFWNPVVERVERRLEGWGRALLSRGGRLTLIQSVLSNLPTYFLSLFRIPSVVAKRVEKLLRNFLWEGSNEGKKNHLVNWEVVSLPKEHGGLGVGNLRKRNEALLGKWLWRFQSESNALWHKVIKSKYGMHENGWDPKRISHGNSRNPWPGIMKVLDKFEACSRFKVGNGHRVRFWEEAWLGASSLRDQFPRLFHISLKKNVTIANMCIDTSSLPLSWDYGFRRNLNDAEVEEFARLSAELEEVLLIQGRGDSRVWRLDSSGLFSVKSFSAHLIANPSSLIFLPSRVIWKAKVPPKVKLLVWLIAHGKVNTCEVIQRKNPYLCFCPNWCILCKCANESLDHLFLSCPIVSSLWSRLCQATGMTGGNFSSCYDLLSSGMNFFGGERKGAVLGICAVMTTL